MYLGQNGIEWQSDAHQHECAFELEEKVRIVLEDGDLSEEEKFFELVKMPLEVEWIIDKLFRQ